jgi:Mg-chelatase subunit ChlD
MITNRRSMPGMVLAGVLLAAAPATAQLFPSPLLSNPTDAQTNVLREMGRKGLLFQFQYFEPGFVESTAGFPLNMGMAQVQLQIGATTHSCPPGSDPGPGNCSYVVVDGNSNGHLDAVRIYYNGEFPAATQVIYRVSGARTADGTEVQDPNPEQVTFATGLADPQPPASVQLVFDVSGSMAWPTVPQGSVQRQTVLKSAAAVLFDMLADYAMLGDKLGLVYFGSSPTTFNLTPATATNLESALNQSAMSTIAADIQASTPGGATAMGGGLEHAREGFDADTGAPPNSRRAVFLFSDGEQNVSPMISVPPPGNTVQVGNAAYPDNIGIYTITAGRQTAPGFVLQRDIAQATGATYSHLPDHSEAIPGPDLATFFTQALQDVLYGDKVETALNVMGRITRDSMAVYRFVANPEDVALTAALSWTGPSPPRVEVAAVQPVGVLPYRLRAPDGTVVDLTHRIRHDTNRSFATVQFPLRQDGVEIDPAGEWTIELLGQEIRSAFVDHHLLVMLDNRTIATDFSIGARDIGTGEPIPIRVRVTEAGLPVVGATVTARAARPGEGLGQILATTSPSPSAPPTDEPHRSPGQEKLYQLLTDPALAGLLSTVTVPPITFTDAGDGNYTASFDRTDHEGHYQFEIEVHGTAPANGEFQRTRRMTAFVRPKPDPAATEMIHEGTRRLTDGARAVRIRVRPRDRFGSLLGPDYTHVMRVLASEGTVVESLEDELDGSYVIEYRLIDPAANPDITLEILGETVVIRPLDQLSPTVVLDGRWELSVHLGATFPHDSLAVLYGGSYGFGAGLGYRLTDAVALEIYGGHDRFSWGADDFFISHVSAQFRVSPGVAMLRPTLQAGVGAYFPRDDSTRYGANVGGGLQLWVMPSLAVEGLYNLRVLDESSLRYGTLQGGVRIRF